MTVVPMPPPGYVTVELKRLTILPGAPKDITEYVGALADISPLVLHRAVSHAILTRAFFPTPVQLRQDADEVAVRLTYAPPEPAPPAPDRSQPLAHAMPPPLLLKNPFTGEVKEIPIARIWKFYCDACEDSGWISHRCPAKHCGRKFEHAPHEWVVRCACWMLNPTLVRKRAETGKYAKAPGKTDA